MSNLSNELNSILNGEISNMSVNLLDEMIDNIGSTDPILRDKLIYSAFWKLIMENHLNKQQLEYILNVLLTKELITFDIENSSTDSVFTRSFTALFYAAILEYDITRKELDEDIVRQVIVVSLEYMEKEQDLRGYVETKGWAHAAAHGADLLDSLVKHPISTDQDAKKVLQNIERLITIAEGYQDDEEERIARAFVSLSQHHLSEPFIIDWIINLDRTLAEKMSNAQGDLQPYYAQLAFKNFLKSAYFLYEKQNIQNSIQNSLKQLIVKLIY